MIAIKFIGIQRTNLFKSIFMNQFLKAVVIISLTIIFSNCNYTAKFKTTSEKSNYTLPDSTLVLLDKHSTLNYKKNFKQRILKVLGKAYIEVAYVEDEDFELHYEKLEIKLIGDEFYIHVDKDKNKVFFNPINGYARAEIKGISGQSIMTIKEGYQLEYEGKNHVIQIREVDNQHFLSWKNEALYFTNTKLDEVAKRLGEEFDAQIKLSSKALEECIITDTITNRSLNSALKELVTLTKTELKTTDKSYILVGDSCVQSNLY